MTRSLQRIRVASRRDSPARRRAPIAPTGAALAALVCMIWLGSCEAGGRGKRFTPPTLAYAAHEHWVTEVIEMSPGAGQHANTASFAMIAANSYKVLGPPEGKGTGSGGIDSVISLHGPGAYVVVRFSPPILDDPLNIGGYDFIVFGNAAWAGGDPAGTRWQEPATVEVMKDENENGLADDTWYLIPGSELAAGFPVPTEMLESRLDAEGWYPTTIAWSPSESHPDWYPDSAGLYPSFPAQISHTFFPIDSSRAGMVGERIWGYLDVTPTLLLGDMSGADGVGDNSLDDPEDYPPEEFAEMLPEYFYTTPDRHGDLGIDPGSGGGDAMDIAWAVDPSTGSPAGLDRVDFIRFANAVKKVDGALGDVDPELDAVSRVRRR